MKFRINAGMVSGGILLAVALAAPAAQKGWTSQTLRPAKPGDSLRVRIKLRGELSGEMAIVQTSTNAVQRIRWNGKGQRDEHAYVAYAKRGELAKAKKLPATTEYPRCGISLASSIANVWGSRLPCFGFDYWFLPYFDMSRGLYLHGEVEEKMSEWLATMPQAEEREIEFAFTYDAVADNVSVWLDRQYAGRLAFRGNVKSLELKLPQRCETQSESFEHETRPSCALPALRGRSHALLGKDAKLEFTRKLPPVGGTPFEVWPAERSLDLGRHRRTTYNRDFGWDPMFCRTPWANGPEYMQWTIPANFYLSAYVLCADIPAEGKVPVLGSSLTRFGASNQDSFAQAFTDLSTAATNKNIVTVGKLKYRAGDGFGKWRETPLYLVRQRLNIGKILHFLNSSCRMPKLLHQVPDYLDFEFVGAGTQKERPRSSVQVFGCTLEGAPYAFDIVETERGNIFEEGERPVTGVEVRALQDATRGTVEYVISDDDFKVLKSGCQSFELPKRGDRKLLSFDLAMPDVGWYQLDYRFLDARNRLVTEHAAAFTLLGRNDREAGFESPYACWPRYGSHNSNTNRAEVAKIMHKAGYHSAWDPPVEDENNPYQITLSAFSKYCNAPYWPPNARFRPGDEAKVSNRIEAAVAHYRAELEKFPHCRTIQLMHEQGYKELAEEMLEPGPAERGEYKGMEGPHLVYWCTEYARRMREEFPGFHIQVGNGSSASAMTAMLAKNGFDFNLVDTLGIESKGFQTMPETPANLESPGMLWALRETAARFGFTNLLLNACNEYVFRPERPYHVSADKSHRERMRVTDFTLRDYLISLAHGCWTISTGHLEDINSQYYDTNWGAGGQCRFYPYTYPKRMFTALATLTKVLDKPKLSRVLDTGANAVYALEFVRERKVRDYAYALWTPMYDSEVALDFPAGASMRLVDWQGRSADAEGGEVKLVVGSTPRYVIADRPTAGVRIVRHIPDPLPGTMTTLVDPAKVLKPGRVSHPGNGKFRKGHRKGVFESSLVRDPQWKDPVLQLRLIRGEPAPAEVVQEEGRIWIGERTVHPAASFDEIGVWVKGDGAFGTLEMGLAEASGAGHNLKFGYRSLVCFNGWQLMRTQLPEKLRRCGFKVMFVNFTTCRQALNPKEMAPVTEPLCLGPIVGIKLRSGERAIDPTERIDEAMKVVDEKDL